MRFNLFLNWKIVVNKAKKSNLNILENIDDDKNIENSSQNPLAKFLIIRIFEYQSLD